MFVVGEIPLYLKPVEGVWLERDALRARAKPPGR